MENPFVTRYDNCAVCETSTTLEKCYNADPRWVKVAQPNAGSPIVISKTTMRVVCAADACEDVCPPVPVRHTVPAQGSKVIIHGEGLYEGEWGTKTWLKPFSVELDMATTTVAGVTYTDFDEFCDAVKALADCGCECE